ncbi:MAG: hypothetical protein ACI837_002254 [Crocinitomicaceae bacterium]|jgi:hypothetical protein
MRILKPVLLGICAVVALSLNAQEEGAHKTPAEKATKRSAYIVDKYSLNAEQAAKVEAAQFEFITSTRKIKEDESITGEVKKSQIMTAKDALHGTMKTVLTDDQFATFTADVDTKIEEKKAMREENNTPEAKAQRKTDHIFATLTDLTEDQKTQIENLNLKVEQKIQAVKVNESLTKDQKVEYIKGNRGDYKAVLETILTEAQFAELQANKSNHKAARKEMKDADTEIK